MAKHRKSSKGLTLIELLVVVLILGILLAVAIPLYLSSVRSSEEKTCRSNMMSIANVAMAFKTQDPSHVFPTAAQMDTQLTKEGMPTLANFKGPNTETYTYTKVAGPPEKFTIACTPGASGGANHGTYDSSTGAIN